MTDIAPKTAPFVLTTPDQENLPNARVLVAGNGLALQDTQNNTLTIEAAENLAAIQALSEEGYVVYDAISQTFSGQEFQSSSTIQVTDGDGVLGPATFSVKPNTSLQLTKFQQNGATIGQRSCVNFVSGTDVNVAMVDDPSENRVNVTVSFPFEVTDGTVTSVGISSPNDTLNVGGGPITESGTLTVDLKPVVGVAGNYTNANISVDTLGRIIAAEDGAQGTVTSVGISSPNNTLNVGGGPITESGTLTVDLKPVAGVAGNYTNPVITVNDKGIITSAQTGIASTVTSVGLQSDTLNVQNSPITSSGNINVDLKPVGIIAQSYTIPDITVDQYGRITAIKNGVAPTPSLSAGNNIMCQPNPITSSGTVSQVPNPIVQVKQITISTYTTIQDDYFLSVDTSVSTTITLAANAVVGQRYVVMDRSGGAASFNIVINVSGGSTINGASSITINTAYGAKTLTKVTSTAWLAY